MRSFNKRIRSVLWRWSMPCGPRSSRNCLRRMKTRRTICGFSNAEAALAARPEPDKSRFPVENLSNNLDIGFAEYPCDRQTANENTFRAGGGRLATPNWPIHSRLGKAGDLWLRWIPLQHSSPVFLGGFSCERADMTASANRRNTHFSIKFGCISARQMVGSDVLGP